MTNKVMYIDDPFHWLLSVPDALSLPVKILHLSCTLLATMKATILLPLLSIFTGVLASVELPAGVPRSIEEFREKHPWKPKHNCRKTINIRASEDDEDDISDEFLHGLKKANHGGTLHLKKDHTYVIGKPLDLTWLDDIQIHLEGEIKFTNDTPYWQENAFRHPFQVSYFAVDR